MSSRRLMCQAPDLAPFRGVPMMVEWNNLDTNPDHPGPPRTCASRNPGHRAVIKTSCGACSNLQTPRANHAGVHRERAGAACAPTPTRRYRRAPRPGAPATEAHATRQAAFQCRLGSIRPISKRDRPYAWIPSEMERQASRLAHLDLAYPDTRSRHRNMPQSRTRPWDCLQGQRATLKTVPRTNHRAHPPSVRTGAAQALDRDPSRPNSTVWGSA